MPSLTRRSFLTTSAASAGALAFGVPAVDALGANEKLNIGLIGCGNRGRSVILECVKNKTVKLEDLKKAQLPPEMQKMTLVEQKAHLEKIDKDRTALNEKARDLDKKRAAFIAQKQADDSRTKGPDTFDGQVLQILQRQATRVNIQYATEGKKK